VKGDNDRVQKRRVYRREIVKKHLGKYQFWTIVISVGFCSCSRKADQSAPAPDSVSNRQSMLGSTNEPPQSVVVYTSVVTSNNEKINTAEVDVSHNEVGAAIPTWYYTTNGDERLKTFVNSREGQIISSKTVDEAGKLKWTDQFSYSSDFKKPVEMRRTKADGTIIQVLYNYSNDGKQTRMVVGSDGKVVPEDRVDTYLNE
jgi:hypothetical protein